ncbi:hypothetical protein M728_004169 (plasmid) [Ensifer sp. WSM1721]|nr:hypothetical protein [Ensifer sp. WSM1721]
MALDLAIAPKMLLEKCFSQRDIALHILIVSVPIQARRIGGPF